MTFVTTYALILPAITVEKEHTDKVAGMYLEQEGTQDDLLEENALEFTGVSIAADQENAVTYEYADDDMTAVAVFSTEEEIPEGAELVVHPVDTESEKYTEFSNRAALLLDSEFIYDVTTCSFYDFALICDGVDVTPKTGLVDVQINFLSNTVSHAEDVVYAGRFGRAAEAEDSFVAMAADITGETADTLAGSAEDELVSANPDESSVIELTDGIITILSLKGNDLAQNDSIVGVLAGYVDEEAKAAAAETDAEVPTVDDIQEETSALEVKTLKAAGEDYTVTLTYDETSGIPDGASLVVSEIAQNTKEYKTYLEKTKKVMGLTEEETLPKYAARFFDIKIMAGNKEFKPESGVSVEITYAEPLAENPETEVSAVHFADEAAKAEVIDANASEIKDDGAATVEFMAESFSVYGVIYTVDFDWEVNGKKFEFAIPGGGFVSFTDLVEVLGIADDTNDGENSGENGSAALSLDNVAVSEATREFVADVASLEFSNPELVDVSKVISDTTVGEIKENRGLECWYSAELTEEQINRINNSAVGNGDWALISMRPFASEETLTVTMKNEEQFVIKVTDAQIHTYVISDSGDTYKITVTYDDKTGIPADAELRARLLTPEDERYQEDIDRSNAALLARYDHEAINPLVFEIKIFAGGKEIEPIEGTQVNVEISLAMDMVSGQPQAEGGDIEAEASDMTEDEESDEDSLEDKAEEGSLLIDGVEYTIEPTEVDLSDTKVIHMTDDGKTEVIEDLNSMVDTDNNVVVTFETGSFSDYMLQGVYNNNGLNGLPDVIYVGDEIYMQGSGSIWVTGIGSVVSETKYDGDDYKSVRATNPGTFRLCHSNNWNNGYTGYTNQYPGKYIRVLPARSEGNNGQPYAGTTPPATIPTVSNASIGLTLNLFDYDLDEYLDNRFNNKDYGDHLDNFKNRGINSGHSLKFWGSGITDSSYGAQNNYVEHGVTSIVNSNLSGGYPTLRSDNTSLDYLFTPSDGTDKTAYLNADGLFKKDGNYYVYNSNENYAWYNPATNKFEVYNSTYKQKSRSKGGEQATQLEDKAIGFFPFHPWDDQYDLYVNWNKNLNHHFGMSMSVPFTLPKDPKAVVDANGDPIIFEFSGDDDLWVFIDGKLAMDIGGIHQPTSGTINFQTGVVTVNGSTQMDNSTFSTRFPNLYDGNQHTLQVFYIERGGCDSNCKIQFNMTLYGDIHFDKVDKDNPIDKLAGAVFGLYKDEDCTIPVMERLKNAPDRAYIAESDANGRVQFSDIPIGTYYLKELHAPEGYPLDDTVHTVQVFYDQAAQQVKVKFTIDGVAVENGVKITNKKPVPITLGLQKEWQNEAGGTIAAPAGAEATFEIKRIRNYETYTERAIEGQGREVSHLTVGWIHNGQMHVHGEYDLIVGTTATVSWGYNTGYTGSKDCIVNGTRIDKDYVTGNVISEALTMPAAGQTATIYIVDDSENGEAIRSINVAGSQFYGNSGGGVIHEFTTHNEPDPTFSYTDANVTNNRVTLPINSNTWSYDFTNLPTFERGSVEGVDHPVSFNYTYYLEEVSNTAPAGTTVVYKDLNGNVINSPTDAETSTSGTQTITNKVPTGYLRIDKAVTYNGISPVPDGKKSDLAGTYNFNVYTDENCSIPCKVIQGEAPNQQEVNLVLTVTIGDDGAARSSETVRLPVGDYWIEEQTPSQTGVTPDENRIKVTITADQTTNEPAIASFTNNKEESNNPDELAIELEKTFTGLPNASKIPGNYQAALTYTYNGSTVTVPLTGSTQGNVTCTKSPDGMTWHWRITQIPKTATDFGVYESNYDITGYTRITKINGSEAQNPGVPQTVSVLVPEITMTNPTSDYTTTDNNKVFTVEDNQILLVRMTNHATVIVSQKSLSYSTRQAIEKMLRDNGGKIPGDDGANAQWVMNFVYFSHEIQGDSFSYGGRTIFFEGNKVKIPHKSSNHEVRVDIGYTSTSAENSFTIENIYTEIPTKVDVLKVEKGNETTIHLPNAVFELRKLEDVAPTPGGTLTYVKENDQVIVSSATTGSNGRLTFSNLTYGVYEIRELTPPPGYIQTEDVTFYLRVDGGVITYVQKGSNKPSEWTAAQNSDGATVYFMEAQAANPDSDPPTTAANATFRVGNTPGAALPNTGGPGTTAFYLLGIMLTAFAGTGLMMRKRRRDAV